MLISTSAAQSSQYKLSPIHPTEEKATGRFIFSSCNNSTTNYGPKIVQCLSHPEKRKIESLATSTVESEGAMSTHDSKPPSGTTDPCCYWCSCISLRDMSDTLLRDEREVLRELFHSGCECLRRENALLSSACGFCKHLNIRHLALCALIHDNSRVFTISSDWYRRENLQNGCQLCEYISSYGISESGIGFAMYKPTWYQWCILSLRGTDNAFEYIRLSQDSASQLQEYVNWEQIRGWLFKTYVREGSLPVDFRVIDVERDCIVTPDYPVRYVALSYVWGKSSQEDKPFQASISNIRDLEIQGSLSRVPLPRTITEAMEVCRQLHRQYLWVDRLCIIQDAQSKHGQIQRMNHIFGYSEFTIIALSGQDANDPLPGVVEPRRSRRLKMFKWQGISFTTFFPNIQDLIQSSYWARRGWTFQEEFCSTNNLYFTEYGVYHSGSGLRAPNSEGLTMGNDGPTQHFRFPHSVEEYAARSFTDPGDLLRAFIGVLNREYLSQHHFGNAAPNSQIQGTTFYQWLHWQPDDWEYEARRPPKDICTEPVLRAQPRKSDIFPSWSWTSAQGGVSFYPNGYPLAIWAFPIAQNSQEGRGIKWVSRNAELTRLREFAVEGGLTRAREYPSVDPGVIIDSSTFFKKADRDEACKKLGRMFSFTQVASLRLKSLNGYLHCSRRAFQIISSAGECMGGIWLPKLSLKYTFNKNGTLKEMEFEFMALSVYLNDEGVESVLDSVWLEDSKDRAALNVMLIWRANGSNVARRLGIGQVFKDQWFKEKPVLKTVILE